MNTYLGSLPVIYELNRTPLLVISPAFAAAALLTFI